MRSAKSPWVSRLQARSRLGILWFCGAAVFYGVVFVQVVFGRYEGVTEEIWAWALPAAAPTLLLMTGVFFAVTPKAHDKRKVYRAYYRLALAISAAYLFTLTAIPFLEPLSPYSPLELVKTVSPLLGFWQGLAAASVGYLFTENRKQTS